MPNEIIVTYRTQRGSIIKAGGLHKILFSNCLCIWLYEVEIVYYYSRLLPCILILFLNCEPTRRKILHIAKNFMKINVISKEQHFILLGIFYNCFCENFTTEYNR